MPELIVVGGPNGAGKTTFANEYVAGTGYSYIGADDIAARLSPEDPTLAQIAASRRYFDDVQMAIAAGRSFVIESTLSGRMFRRTLEEVKSAGFEISIVYLFLNSADACVDRVRERVAKGGHNVPQSDIRRRFARSLRNFWYLYRPLADHWFLAYNSGNEPFEFAVGTTSTLSVRDETLFADFEALLHQ